MSPTPAKFNPFPGLRPFTQEEDYLFFGREEQTLELLQRLNTNRFVAVVGTSGSGKSSLVRCGLLSELLGGRMLVAGASWEIAVTHPGGNPLAILTDSLLDADIYDREGENVRENLLATLSRSHFGLVEAVKQAALGEDTNFLLVVDQFEEIFRFQEAGQRQQEVANEFVSLLLEAADQKEVPIYVVLTMRSDFIGECGQFEGLAEMVNRAEFLIPRLSREQYKRVIEGPIKVAGGKISPRLLQRLLNDLGQQADQLPCLQHALMRTWDVWAAKGDADALDLDDYQSVGKMSQALSLHADEIFDSLASDRQRELCGGIFQALTVEESNNRGIRRPQRLGRLCQILEVPADELRPIIDAYRQSGVTFLMPPPDVELTEQTIVDISHESLMRVWTRLRQWVEEETQAAGIYHRLSESADLHAQSRAGLYRDPELGIALAWKEAKHPNSAWADRYRPGFHTAMAFLEASRQATVDQEQEQEAARQHELDQVRMLAQAERARAEIETRSARRLRVLLAGAAVVAMIAVGASLVAVSFWRDAHFAKQAAERAEQSALTSAKAAQTEAERASAQGLAAQAARRDAEQNLTGARTAIDDFLVKVSESQLLSAPGLQPLRAELLASASKFYEDFLARNPDNRELKAGLADAFYRLGFVSNELGNYVDAEQTLEKSIALWDSALKVNPTDPVLRNGLAAAWFEIARARAEGLAGGDASGLYEGGRKAAQLWTALSADYPQHVRYKKQLARAFNLMGMAGSNNRDFPERSFLAYQQSLQIRLDLLSDNPTDVELLHGLAESFNNLGLLVADSDHRLSMLQRSVEFNIRVNQLRPQNVEYALDLAIGHSVTAALLYQKTRHAEALASYRSAVDHMLGFIQANPAVSSMREMLVNILATLRSVNFPADQADAYAQIFHEVQDRFAKIPRRTADDHLFFAQVQADEARQIQRAYQTVQMRELTADQKIVVAGLRSGAIESLRLAVRAGLKDVQRLREDPILADVRTQSGFNQILASMEMPNPSGATTVKQTSSPDTANNEVVRLEQDRATSYLTFGMIETRFNRNQQAAKYLEQALALRQPQAAADPANQQRKAELSLVETALARLLWNEGRLTEAQKLFDQRTASLEQALQQRPQDRVLETSLAEHHRSMADSFANQGLWEEAVPHYVAALKSPSNQTTTTEDAEVLTPALLLLSGDEEAYVAARVEILKKFGTDPPSELAARIARMYALRPIDQNDLATIVALAEKARFSWHAYTYALVLYRAGRFDDAIRTIEEAHRTNTYEQLHLDNFVLAMAHFQLGHHDEARKYLDTAGSLSLSSMPLWMHFASSLLDVDWIILRREASELIHRSPYSGKERMRRGLAFSQFGDFEKSTAEFASVVEGAPDYPLGHFAYAHALAQAGHQSQAGQVLDKARRLFDEQTKGMVGDVECWRLHGETLSLLKRHAEAIQIFRIASAAQSLTAFNPHSTRADRQLLFELQDRLLVELRVAGVPEEVSKAGSEQALLLKVLELPQQIRDANDLLRVDPAESRDSGALIAGIDQLVAAYEKSLAENAAICQRLLARLHQRRAALLQTAGRSDKDVLAAQSSSRKLFEDVLALDPRDTESAGALAELMLSRAEISWTVLKPTSLVGKFGTTLTHLPDGSILASGKQPNEEIYTVAANPGLTSITAVRLETLPHPSLSRGGSGRDPNGSFYLREFSVAVPQSGAAPDQNLSPLKLSRAVATYHRANPNGTQSPIENAIDGQPSVWDLWPEVFRRQEAVFEVAGSQDFSKLPLVIQLTFGTRETLGCFRLSATDRTDAYQAEESRIAALKLTDPWAKLAAAYFLQDNQPAVEKLLKQYPAAVAGIGDMHALQENWPAAIAEYSKAITPETTEASLLAKRGTAYEKLKQFDLAFADFTRAGQLDANVAFARFKSVRTPLSRSRWTLGVQNGGAGSMDIVDGTLNLRTTVATGTDYQVQAQQDSLQLVNGSQYVIRFKMKSPDALPVGLLAQVSGHDWHEIGLNETIIPPTEFQNYEFTLVPQNVVPGNSRIVFNLGTKTGSATIKDFVILRKFDAQEFDLALRAAERHPIDGDQAVAAYTRALEQASSPLAAVRVINSVASRIAQLEQLIKSTPPKGESRNQLAGLVAQHEALVDTVLQGHPGDPQLPLAVARKFAERGQQHLSGQRPAEAQAHLQKALDVFSGLRARLTAVQWQVLTPSTMSTKSGVPLQGLDDQSILATGPYTAKDTYTMDFDEVPQTRTIRLEALRDPSLPGRGPGTHDSGNFVLSDLHLFHADRDLSAELKPVSLRFASATFEERPAQASLERGESGWSISRGLDSSPTAYFGVAPDEVIPKSNRMRLVLDFYHEPGGGGSATLGRFRVAVSQNDHAVAVAPTQLDLKDGEVMDVTIALAKAHVQQGRLDQAVALLSAALDQSTDRAVIAQIVDAAQTIDGVLEKLVEHGKDNPWFLAERARYLADHGQTAKAEAFRNKAHELFELRLASEPNNALAAAGLADLLWNTLPDTKRTWIDETTPVGANLQGTSPWEFVGLPNHPVFSGQTSVRLKAEGAGQHFFTDALPRLKIGEGARMFAYVFLDPHDPPKTLMLQFHDGEWEHRAFWGEDLVEWGDKNTGAHVSMGPLPKAGGWARLEVEAKRVGLRAGAELNGWSFTQHGGTCYWDAAGCTNPFQSPWHKLAATHHLLADQKSLDQLLQHHPEAAAAIGDQYAANQQWDKAIVEYDRAITANTTDATLFAARASAHQKLEHWDQAIADWTSTDLYALNKATRYGSPSYPALEQRALIHGHIQQWDQQVPVLSELLKPERLGDNPWIYNKRGEAYDRLRDFIKARADYDLALKYSSSSDVGALHFFRGRHFAAQGQWMPAAEDVRQLYLTPSDFTSGGWPRTEWWCLRDAALIFAMAGDESNYRQAALECYRRSLTNSLNEYDSAWTVNTMLYLPGAMTQENRPQLEKLAAASTEFWRPRLKAAIHFRLGEYAQAAEFFDANHPGSQCLFLASMIYHKLGRRDRARQLLDEGNRWVHEQRAADPGFGIPKRYNWTDWGIEIALQNEALDLILGSTVSAPRRLALQGQTARAVDAYAKLLTESTDNDAKSRVIHELGEFAEVLTELRQRLPDDQSVNQAYRHLAEKTAAELSGRLDALARQGGEGDGARFQLISSVIRRRDDVTETLLKLRQDDPLLHGVHALFNNDWKNAAVHYAKVIESIPDANSIVWMTPPSLAAYAGDARMHRELCQKMHERFRNSTTPEDTERCLKMMLLMDHGPDLPPDDVKRFEAACDRNVDGQRGWFQATRALMECRRGHYAEAHRWTDEVLAWEKEAPNAYIKCVALAVKALTFARQKDVANARQSLDQLTNRLTHDMHLTWNADGLVDGPTIASGAAIEHDKLIPEILRLEAEKVLQSDGKTRE